ncbi:hypothetical protein HP398_29695 [Brevibacillus sp. HB1.4B]|uniref:hypothetical protein n=1 Tax=Brevibacillus sp. HB1.4B TaxID=2738845 RepID=UPI00156B0C02|nr:hypothetical protein [Brevibacillus sp. HB1.4B]NRS20596.1 hypothetical protein [Brevibacillus sp. HB1.4B]
MLIFSKKAFQFDHPAGQEPAVVVRAHDFTEVPDWVKKSSMFKLASQTSDVTVTESKQSVKDAEAGTRARSAAERKAEEQAQKEAESNTTAETEQSQSEQQK